MTPQAQNALLLTLEEPPAYVLFLLLCNGADNLLETIRSRAPVLRTEPIPEADIRTYLKKRGCSLPEEDLEAEWEIFRRVLAEAVSGYDAMRSAEGAKAEADIKAKIELVRSYADEVEQISLADTVGYRDKLEARIRQILGDAGVAVDENRLLTECAVWADKIAIDEELVRLRSHFGAFYDICASAEPSGRKLDFLMQELNRETNTIGSKANNASIARIVVNMKGELEKIREQVQNIE